MPLKQSEQHRRESKFEAVREQREQRKSRRQQMIEQVLRAAFKAPEQLHHNENEK
jgi:hypothetical protein